MLLFSPSLCTQTLYIQSQFPLPPIKTFLKDIVEISVLLNRIEAFFLTAARNQKYICARWLRETPKFHLIKFCYASIFKVNLIYWSHQPYDDSLMFFIWVMSLRNLAKANSIPWTRSSVRIQVFIRLWCQLIWGTKKLLKTSFSLG